MNRTTKILAFTVFAVLVLPQAAAVPNATKLDPVLIQTDPFPAEAGEDLDVQFKVRNTGTFPLRNVTIEVLDTYPFTVLPDARDRFRLGTVRASGWNEYFLSTEVRVAPDASDGRQELQLRITTGNGTRESVVKAIPIQVASTAPALSIANLQTKPSTLLPDTEDNSIRLSIVNNGDETAESVHARIKLPEGFTPVNALSTTASLGSLQPGMTRPVSFSFDIADTVESGIHVLPVQVNYTESEGGKEHRIMRRIQIAVSGRPQFRLVNITSSLSTGSRGRIRLTVRNVGGKTSESTRVRVLENSDLPVSFESSNRLVGTLQPGMTGTVVFTPTVEKDAIAQEYILDFEVRGVEGTSVFVEDVTGRIT
ncbi:MAG: NEW3 domain-containing protein, partial [Candidatus Nanohaloarchaea archaeon]|nr:NEW3 domain-containing protein [Candidatus Nanohaloarchaea archaeon]